MILKDKTIIITGSARGLGMAYALRLSKEGARVVIADVLDTAATQKTIAHQGGKVLALYTDVSDEESTLEMARRTIEHFGGIDVLINNAGISVDLQTKPFFNISVKEWDQLMQVNLKGTFLCCKAVYPHMKKQGRGKIINVTSPTFHKGAPNMSHYVASKGGVIGLTRVLARELGGDGISVNAVAPGFTPTAEMQKKYLHQKEVGDAAILGRCFKRAQSPEDLTGTIVFLASSESDFITGQTLIVDGGSEFI